jgi:hypothetical protein
MKNSFLILLAIVMLTSSCKKDNNSTSLQAPVATEATNVSSSSFTANWNTVSGANDYSIQVAEDADFNTTIYSLKNVGPSSNLFDALESNTEYFYKVQATNNGGSTSGNSNVISVFTLPNAPVTLDATNINSTGFTANWMAVDDLTDYLLYVSFEQIPGETPVYIPGYEGLALSDTTHIVTGLMNNTVYWYTVQVKAGTRVSEMSAPVVIVTDL